MLEIRTIPTPYNIGREYLSGLRTQDALEAMWRNILRKAYAERDRLIREGQPERGEAHLTQASLGVIGSQNLQALREQKGGMDY